VLTSEQQRMLGTIHQSSLVLLQILNDILDYFKIEAGKLAVEHIAVSLPELVQDVLQLMDSTAQNRSIALEVWVAPELPTWVFSDPTRLRQVLLNLVGNAIKFTRQGHIGIEASEISRNEEGALLEFAVSDSGVGIAADKQCLLFHSFTQADTSITREYGGSGLGLSIVRKLAELMGGGVGVHSEPGQGSRFWFRVWLAHARAMASAVVPASTPAAQPSVEAAPQQFAGHVLVVEDNRINQLVIQTLLGKRGVQVTLAGDGQQALDVLKARPPVAPFDLVLMDLQMPVLDGCSATRALRAWEAQTGCSRLPVVALTAGAFADDRQQCMDAGMDAVLTKPIDKGALEATLARWLGAGVPL
jgi:CheY-like chemotaxis protein